MDSIEVLDGFLLACQANRKSPRTIRWYDDKLRPVLRFAAERGHTDLEKFPRAVVNDYLLTLQCTPTTTNGYIKALKRLVSWAISEDVLERSPLEKLKLVKAPKKHIRVLTEVDVERFLKACLTERDRALALFLYDTGCRVSEALTLTLDRLNLQEGWALVQGKGNKERIVPLGSRATAALWKYLRVRPKVQHQQVFLSRLSRPLKPVSVHHAFEDIAARAGLERANPHLFRHSSATALLRQGVPTAVVKEILGHHSVTITEGYLHLIAQDVLAAHRQASPADRLKK